jgi:hypothetical protein
MRALRGVFSEGTDVLVTRTRSEDVEDGHSSHINNVDRLFRVRENEIIR